MQQRLNEIIQALDLITDAQIDEWVEFFTSFRQNKQSVYVLGNGGSCANASHFVLHLRQNGVRAYDLLADFPYVTAMSNDFGYHLAPLMFLKEVSDPNDVLVLVSGSGNSKNLLEAAGNFDGNVYLHAGMRTVLGLLGRVGDEVKVEADCTSTIIVSSNNYSVVEDIHSVIIHLISERLKR